MADLRDMGLSEYESRVYRTLLDVGSTTAKELSDASEVPMGRIYDVLNGLETHDVIRSQTASRPKKYVAVEPETALDRLLAVRRDELAEAAEQYESVAEELTRELEPGPVEGEEFWTAALGREETLDLFLERVDAADDRLVMVTGVPAAGFELGDVGSVVADHLADAVDRGVEVSVLVSYDLANSVPDAVGERYAADLGDRENFAIRVGDVEGSFTVVDESEVCIEVPNPLDPDEALALIDLQNPSFAADVDAEFAPRWEAATPL